VDDLDDRHATHAARRRRRGAKGDLDDRQAPVRRVAVVAVPWTTSTIDTRPMPRVAVVAEPRATATIRMVDVRSTQGALATTRRPSPAPWAARSGVVL
jgi:hypothetical protein